MLKSMLIGMPILRVDDLDDWVIEKLKKRADAWGVTLTVYIANVLMKAAAERVPEDEPIPVDDTTVDEPDPKEEPLNLTGDEIALYVRIGRCEYCFQRYLRGELEP